MDYHYFKSKLNHYYARYVNYDKRPIFFDINQTYPSLNRITNHYQSIKREFEAVTQQHRYLPAYHEIDPGEADISNTTAKNWNVYMIYLLGYQSKEASALCPTLCELLKSIPNLIQAFFSILEPGKEIPLHEGPYIGYLRYHLGIHIPKHNPPEIIVNNEPYQWREGEAVLFDDSWPHKVHNQSNDYRVVLIIDVLRPLPFMPNLVNQIVTNLFARYFYGRKVMKRALKYDLEVTPLAK